uniref:Uncharacterized protein n=1 Tax=Anguilla anguilla TaxID=7936 RepID=A0A0E9QND2_ANGAN
MSFVGVGVKTDRTVDFRNRYRQPCNNITLKTSQKV